MNVVHFDGPKMVENQVINLNEREYMLFPFNQLSHICIKDYVHYL